MSLCRQFRRAESMLESWNRFLCVTTAAMIGSYVDLYRVKLGAAKRKNYSAVHKDFGYKGSDYRLKRSAETAAHYTLPQLEACLQVLLELDQSLKSQPVAAQTLLETALCRLALAGSGR